MKKTYKKPTAKAIALDLSEILAGSEQLGYGGSNSGGGPTTAESKRMMFVEDDDDEDW